MGDGLAPLRRRTTRSRDYTLARTVEVYSTYYDVKYPGHERQAGRPLRVSPTYERLRELGAAFGEKSGWERANWFEPNAAAGDESLRPRGWAGRLWSPAIGAEHRACREAAALFDETSLREDRRRRATGPPTSSSASAPTASPATSAQSPTRRCSTRAAGSSATSPSRGSPRTASASSPARPSASTTSPGSAQHAPDDGSVARRGRDRRATRASGSGARRAREILQPLTTTDLSNAAFPYMRARELAVGVGAVPRAARHLRRRARLGALLPDRVRARASGTRSGTPAASTGSSRAATRRSTRCGSRRATASGAPTSRLRTRLTRPGSASRSSSTRATSSGARRWPRAAEPERQLVCIVLEDPRSVALGSEPVRIDGELVGRVTSGGYGYTVERSIAYAYVPAAAARRRARRSRSRSSASWVAGEVAAEPLFDPPESGSGTELRR